MDFRKKKNEKNYKSYRPEKWIDYAHHHSPQLIRFVVWYHKYFFQKFFLRSIFTHFYYIFDPHCMPCTSQWGKFSSSKFCISDFRIEIYTKFQSGKHIILYILANFIFHTKCPRNPGQILNPNIPFFLKKSHKFEKNSFSSDFILWALSTVSLHRKICLNLRMKFCVSPSIKHIKPLEWKHTLKLQKIKISMISYKKHWPELIIAGEK